MEQILSQLTQVVIHVNHPDIQTVDALFAKMLDDQVGGKMLARLFYWFSRSVKTGGWVYKSWRNWSAECALSVAQIKRVHRVKLLEQFGIHRKLMKANGAPTVHYRLDLKVFLYRVAEFLNVTVEEIQKYFTSITLDPPPKDVTAMLQAGCDAEDNPPSAENSEMLNADPIVGNLTAKDLWQVAKVQWEHQFDRATYLTYFHRATYRDFCSENQLWTIHVPSQIICQMLQTRLYRNVKQTLSSMMGFECEIAFAVG